jgi:hypothetical protein
MSAIGRRYQKTGEDRACWEDLASAVVNRKACELAL